MRFEVKTHLEEIRPLLPYEDAEIDGLLHINRGPKGGNMTTFGLEMVVRSDEVYRLTPEGLQLSKDWIGSLDLEEATKHPARIEAPDFVEVRAVWDSTPAAPGEGNNILGDNGTLILPTTTLEIPSVEAREDLLAYYGATLIRPGDTVRFPNEEFPIWSMEVGERYVDEFLMTEQGGGFYLEYHTDRPHFHLLRKGGGHYILAKWNEEKTALQITGFRIPEGYAVYTRQGVIHCDAALTGEDLAVGYSTSNDCSTVLLRDSEGQYVNVVFDSAKRGGRVGAPPKPFIDFV